MDLLNSTGGNYYEVVCREHVVGHLIGMEQVGNAPDVTSHNPHATLLTQL